MTKLSSGYLKSAAVTARNFEFMKHAIRTASIATTFACLLAVTHGAAAGDVKTAVGGGVGGAAGALIGEQVGGKNGAVIGGALGGGAGAAATTSGSGKTGAIVGGAVGGAAGAAVGQKVGGANGAVIGAGIGGAAGAELGKKVTKKDDPAPAVQARAAQPAPMPATHTTVIVRGDDDGHSGKHHGKGKFCPPGQAKKGNC